MKTFTCNYKNETWTGTITVFKNYGTHFEFIIQSRSSILVVFGKTSCGYFACIPDFNVGCHLANFNDVFWNTERLSQSLGIVDGITVASALKALTEEIYYPEF